MVAGLRAVRAPVLVLRLYIETVLEVILATYAEAPSAETAMPRGYDPVAMVPIEVRMPVGAVTIPGIIVNELPFS